MSCVAGSHTVSFSDICIPPVIQNLRLYFKLTAQQAGSCPRQLPRFPRPNHCPRPGGWAIRSGRRDILRDPVHCPGSGARIACPSHRPRGWFRLEINSHGQADSAAHDCPRQIESKLLCQPNTVHGFGRGIATLRNRISGCKELAADERRSVKQAVLPTS